MIEILACLGLFITYLIGSFTNLFNKYELFNAAFGITLMFIIYARFFVTVALDKAVKESKRIMFEGHIYIVCTLLMILGYLYYSNIWEFFIGGGKYLKLSMIILELIAAAGIKTYTLRLSNIYGKHYIICHVLDLILVLSMIIIDLLTNELKFASQNWLIILSFALIISTALLNEYILQKMEYWTHLKAFIERVRMMTRNQLLDAMIVPPTRNLQNDLVYNHCIYILDKSNFRILECHKLAEIVKHTLMEEGIDLKTAQLVSSQFLANLNTNLMRRKYDNLPLPSFITSTLQKRKTKNL